MRQSFRQSMAWLHTWSALLPGWLLYFIFLTGATGYFFSEIDRWMRPELPLRHALATPAAVAQGVQRLQQDAPNATRWVIEFPDRDTYPYVRLSWWSRPSGGGEALYHHETKLLGANNARGRVESRETGGGQALYQMHWGLHYLPRGIAYWIVGACAMCLFVALISGVIAHRRIFKDLFTFRPRKGQRSWLDAHNVLGVLALPFYLMITYSGLVLLMSVYLPVLMDEVGSFDGDSVYLFDRAFDQQDALDSQVFETRRAGVKAPLMDLVPLVRKVQQDHGRMLSLSVHHPGDANARIVVIRRPNTPISRMERLIFDGVTGELLRAGAAPFSSAQVNHVLTGLHTAVYSGPLLRWLYFVSGLAGAGMIATGLVLWTVKRRRKQGETRGLALVERLNVGVIAGLPIGIAAYFWANRLIPVGFPDRSSWELNTLFVVWALLWLYSATRPLMRSWFELSCLAAMAYGLLPLLNALTTDRHLGVTLAHDGWRGDWELAGFDFTVMGLGLLFASIAWRVRQRVEAPRTQSAQASFSNMQIEVVE